MLLFLRFTAVFALLLVGGCAKVNVGKKIGLDTDIQLVLHAKNDINPDEKDRPSPVFIRLYELKAPIAFHQADFMTLYNKDKAVLEGDFIAKQELKRIIPGETRQEHFVLNPATKFVALYAEFYQYKNANYKVIFEVKPGNVFSNQIDVELTANHMVLLPKK